MTPRLTIALSALVALTSAPACTSGPYGTGPDPDLIVTPRPEPDAGSDASGTSTPAPSSGPLFDPVTDVAGHPAPPLSGGTLLVLADGRTAIAADPDRDLVYVADLVNLSLTATIELNTGDEPGRAVEGTNGRVHVVLRRGGAVVTLNVATGTIEDQRGVCAAPRGLAVDLSRRLLHVACANGDLVTLGEEPRGIELRRLALGRDLRDVVIDGDHLLVSRFRSADVLVVEADGQVSKTLRPLAGQGPYAGQTIPSVAWRLIPFAGRGGALLTHQRAADAELPVDPAIKGPRFIHGGPCRAVVETAISHVRADVPGARTRGLPGAVLPVDIALGRDGARVAVLSAGSARLQGAGVVWSGPVDRFLGDGECGSPGDPPAPLPPGSDPVALAFDAHDRIVVQLRQPASLWIQDQVIALSADERRDVGYAIFHTDAGGGIACASCHPEGGEDGRVWRFAGQGKRRTPPLWGGVLATAPYRWDGSAATLADVSRDMFVQRMGGPALSDAQLDALARWMDRLVAPPTAPVVDPARAEAIRRGRRVFSNATAGCVTCHSGFALTNDTTVDAGTGGVFQVPQPARTGLAGPFPARRLCWVRRPDSGRGLCAVGAPRRAVIALGRGARRPAGVPGIAVNVRP